MYSSSSEWHNFLKHKMLEVEQFRIDGLFDSIMTQQLCKRRVFSESLILLLMGNSQTLSTSNIGISFLPSYFFFFALNFFISLDFYRSCDERLKNVFNEFFGSSFDNWDKSYWPSIMDWKIIEKCRYWPICNDLLNMFDSQTPKNLRVACCHAPA